MFLGELHERGMASGEDLEALFRGYMSFAEGGDANYMNHVAHCCARGQGVVANEGEATKWFRRSAEAGHPSAMLRLAQRYRDGLGVERDDDAATRWTVLAAEAENPDAMLELARLHELGLGVPRSRRLAMQWRLKARAAQVVRWWNRVTGKEWSWPGLPAPLPVPNSGASQVSVVRG
jgi:TPR repeat protein